MFSDLNDDLFRLHKVKGNEVNDVGVGGKIIAKCQNLQADGFIFESLEKDIMYQ